MLVISCSICCDPILPDNVVLHLKCGHIFHEDCLMEWLKRSKTCPECRTKTKKPTRVFPNFTTTSPDDPTSQLILIQCGAELVNNSEFNFNQLSQQLAQKEAELRKSVTFLTETKSKVINDLRNEIIILEERISDLLFEKSIAKLTEKENIVMLDKCKLELKYTQLDLKRRNELIECFERVNSDLQIKLNELEIQNKHLTEQVRIIQLSASSTHLKRKWNMDELTSQNKKIIFDLDDDDDCVIVIDDDNC